MDFYGKRVLVTGGAREIGRAAAQAFAARGALDQAIAASLKTISLQDILGWFGHSSFNLRYR